MWFLQSIYLDEPVSKKDAYMEIEEVRFILLWCKLNTWFLVLLYRLYTKGVSIRPRVLLGHSVSINFPCNSFFAFPNKAVFFLMEIFSSSRHASNFLLILLRVYQKLPVLLPSISFLIVFQSLSSDPDIYIFNTFLIPWWSNIYNHNYNNSPFTLLLNNNRLSDPDNMVTLDRIHFPFQLVFIPFLNSSHVIPAWEHCRVFSCTPLFLLKCYTHCGHTTCKMGNLLTCQFMVSLSACSWATKRVAHISTFRSLLPV